MARRGLIGIVGAVGVIAAGGAYALHTWRHDAPRRTVESLGKAIRERDTTTVYRLVDLPTFSDQLVREAAVATQVQTLASGKGSAVALSSDVVEKMLPTVARSTTISLKRALVGITDSTASPPQMLAPLMPFSSAIGRGVPVSRGDSSALPSRQAVGGVEWLGMEPVRYRGDTAIVALRARDRLLPKPVTIPLRLVLRDGDWVVIAIDRAGDILVDLQQQQSEVLAKVNDEIGATMASLVRVDPLQRSVASSEYGIRTFVTLTARVTNVSPDPVELLMIEPRSSNEALDREVGLIPRAMGQMPPGGSKEYWTIIEYNQFIDWHTTLRYGSVEKWPLVPVIMIKAAGTARADTLRRFSTWAAYVGSRKP